MTVEIPHPTYERAYQAVVDELDEAADIGAPPRNLVAVAMREAPELDRVQARAVVREAREDCGF